MLRSSLQVQLAVYMCVCHTVNYIIFCYTVDGGWTEWEYSYPCSVPCGKGTETFSRTCTNPEPECGGKKCDGPDTLSKECDTQKPCPRKLNKSVYVVFIKYTQHFMYQ